MTTQQLIDLCVVLDASRYYSASKRLSRMENGETYLVYNLVTNRGNEPLSHYEGASFEACYAQFEQAMNNPSPENNE